MLTLAVSNLAWSPDQTERAYALLAEHRVRGLEVAPGLLFPEEPDSFEPTKAAVVHALARVDSFGLELVSMQSLLFGIKGAELFGGVVQRETFVRGVERTIRLASRLGIPNLVLGSPKCRVIPPDLDRETAWKQAREALLPVADLAAEHACVLAIEPNPSDYGTNFITSISEAVDFCDFVDHPAMTLNFDVGAAFLTGEAGGDREASYEPLARSYHEAEGHVSHIHLSTPHLMPVNAHSIELVPVLRALRGSGTKRYVSIEMRGEPPHQIDTLRRAVVDCLAALEEVRHE